MDESYGISPDERFTPRELAAILGVNKDRLVVWRKAKKGPPYVRVVGRIFYPKVAFEEWLKQNINLV